MTNAQTNGPCPNWTFNTATNQISGLRYDAAGDVLNDGSNTYTWDAEVRMSTMNSGGATVYNALGFAGITDPAGHTL